MICYTKWKICGRLFILNIILLSLLTSSLNAQPSEIPFHLESYRLESGSFNGATIKGEEAVNVFSGTVELNDAPWIQLFFGDANLGINSYIIITSLKDGYWQKLDAVSIEQWNYFSAFFNGGVVKIALYAAPYDQDIFFKVDEVVVGEWVNGFPIESQCGPTDDRISSNQPATSRLMNIGCTAWIIPNGHFVSAGHCLDGSANYVEFQVPPSLPGGTIQHPGPEDQYSVNVSTKIFTNGGVGDDWGTFEVFPNSITGLMPKQAQGAYWPLKQDLGPDSIRITGYGVDSGVDNQTQQTHVGPNASSSGTTMRYVTDTEGGNSGSPVIDELTGYAVGVHTHGGCTTSGTGNNNGTSFFHTAFWDAVDQGIGGCPVEPASNPNPAHGTSSVPLNLSELTWTNGAGALLNELYFGTDPGSMTLMQSGSLATSWTITGVTLQYGTDYYWQVVGIGDTCDTPGPVWSFTTVLDPLISVDSVYVYPQSVAFWTGTTDGATKTDDSEVRGFNTEDGWMIFDVSVVPNDATISQVTFYGYVNDTNWPYWSATPLAGLDPLTASASDLKTAIEANSGAGVAYLFRDEGSGYVPGWKNHIMENTANADMQAALGQDWFAIGMDSRDNSATYYLNWDGWNQGNVPYLSVVYQYIIPVELTSFSALVNEGNVVLSWSTATETNNSGFEIQRLHKNSSDWEKISFIPGFGTSTEIHSYTFTDESVRTGIYSYRLKQNDYDGTFEYSNVLEVNVIAPDIFALEQNYPNPFNPSTMIKFSLAADSKVSLTVFDVLGQEVANLINGNIAAGSHDIDFNASNINSGVYFYRIDATGVDGTNFTAVKKMILTK
jgi:V8-like Glu-specific endopeptidase